ncbi:apolipoprotein N-acyltransferase [Thiobacillus sedimenti]|uniref:Apolipoprotein N-acyltransferase n=1 Tax=Thiobacillus sedimenti TaxID=3110231 RepID=A0ABZ1CI36_9PROT|nr:apolipoprotein N-acyltransferase [Thiobacillus sp. SCUT-2]WRS39062.1 apolipoprotein N-acyltransferase [Thiobacillus sp. SCUT-2]
MRSLLASVVAGAASVAGFAPFGLWPLPVLGLAVLFAQLARTSSMRAGFLTGLAWGLGFFLAGVSWVYVSLSVYGGMPAWLAGLATFLFCGFLALFPAAVGAVQARWPGSPASRLLLLMPLAWGVGEWTRGWIFTGFPWLAMGYAQVPGGPLAGYAPLVGVYGVSYLLAVIAALLAWAATARASLPPRLWAAAAAVALAVGGQALAGIRWTVPEGAPTSVALLQGNIPQDMKWRPEKTRETLMRYARMAAASPARLIVLPETALPLFESDLPEAYREGLDALGRRNGGDILTGLPTGSLDGAYYNSVVSFGRAPSQRYSKVHLVPFGEYIPLKAAWGWIIEVLHIPLSDFARGAADQRPLAIGGQRVAADICYEDAFGEEIIRQLPEASVLANVSNLAWFGDSLAPWQHAQMSQMRALETGRMMLRATNTGLTAIIDTRGRIVASLPLFTAGSLGGRVQGYAGSTPYVRWGNAPVLAFWGLLGVGLLTATLYPRGAGRGRTAAKAAPATLRRRP